MYEIVDWILEYQRTEQEKELEKILTHIHAFIFKTSKKVDSRFREDIIQELRMGAISVVKKIRIEKREIDSAFFSIENFNILKEHHFSLETISNLFPIPYLIEFLKNSDIYLFQNAFMGEDYYHLLNAEFNKFNAQNQFFSILKKRFHSIIASFYRNNGNFISLEINLLNRCNHKGKEWVEELEAPIAPVFSFEALGFSTNDALFLKLFIEEHRVLTQYEVSKKLGVSQQYVSKKISMIKKKYLVVKKS